MDGLTRITGDPKYKRSAMDAIKYAFGHLRSPNGLLYWGIAVAYDARSDDICGERITHHTLKYHYPYYELMWEIDPEATDKFIESFWIENILDWSNLDMNRYGLNDRLRNVPKGWNHKYKGGPVFFKGKGRSFFNASSDLFYAAAILSKLSGENEPLVWSKRLAHRYIETRNPKTGISAYVYSRVEPTAGQIQLGDDFREHLVYQGTLTLFPVYPGYRKRIIEMVQQVRGWICELLLGDLLGADGKEFTRWALEELVAWGKVAYRKEDNSFIPMLTDGTSLEGYVFKKGSSAYGPKGTVISAWPLGPIEFWAYSLAYRMSGNQYTWEMARNIALGNNFGDIGVTAREPPQLYVDTNCSDPYALLGFLELYRKTGDSAFLEISKRIGDNMLSTKFYRGFFVPSKEHIYTRFDVPVHLALLHLHAAMKPQLAEVPRVWPSCPFFNSPYRNRPLEHDIYSIYTLTESPDLPISLHEAATLGDINQVTLLVSQGTDIDAWDFDNKAPLHYAAMNGHKQVVELLLAKGADLNTESSAGSTALSYAAGEGQLNVVRFLIAKNADINAGRVTPLHSAARAGHKDIIELLIAKGANVNAKNNDGQTPVDIAVSRNRSGVVKLLIDKGADVPLHVAARFGALAKVKILIEKGDDVNAKDTANQTPLHYAARRGHKEIVELLLVHGADVNAGAYLNLTAAELAMQRNHNEVVELLVSKGADIPSLHLAIYLKDKAKARRLIEAGADVNKRTPYGTTPLDRAVSAGLKSIVELLIEKGADVNAKDNWDWTPLHSAAEKGHRELAELLIANGANVNAKDGANRIPLWYAEKKSHTENVELLRKHGTKE